MYILLLLLIWPFHHKKPVVPDTFGAETQTEVQLGLFLVPDSACIKSKDGFFIQGPDGMVGFSPKSCNDAYVEWEHTDPPKTKMRQIKT